MRNYVIINGTNSLTIPGLAIRELPAISKTLMRNQKEEIDGRDGDIITELGYSAYDKTMTIGLYGSYDINQIIAFFNQKGTIVFSDEPDKYYNFTILEKIDYDKLVKFRTASVRIHCQPFKYPVSETPVEIEAEYVTATAEDITLNNTGVAPLEIGLKGNTYQETTTGKNEVGLQDKASTTTSGLTYSISGDILTINGTASAKVEIEDLLFNLTNQTSKTLRLYLDSGTFTAGALGLALKDSGNSQISFIQVTYDVQYLITTKTLTLTGLNKITLYATNGSTFNNAKFRIMLRDSTTGEYEPYTNGASPNPDYPQEVQVVTGDNTIIVCNENILNRTTCTENNILVWTTGANYNSDKSLTSDYIKTNVNENYSSNYWASAFFYDKNKIYLGALQSDGTTIAKAGGGTKKNFTIPNVSNIYYVRLVYRYGSENDNVDMTTADIMVNKGNTLLTYIPHQEQEYEINLGTLELCKIGTYQDYLYKSGENWYKHKEIGKWTININASALSDGEYFKYVARGMNPAMAPQGANKSSNFFSTRNRFSYQGNSNYEGYPAYVISNQLVIQTTTTDTIENFLQNVNGGTFYYQLATPTEEQITNAELIEQLEAILNAVSYEDQTNISQENDNMAFILDVSALKKGTDMAIVNNEGNIAAKPIIAVKGNGTLGIYLDNTQMFSLNMTSDITIDTENMEAYDPNTLQLRNRQVTGDYSKFALQPGNNTIKVTGDFTSVTISKYKRWL